MKNLYWFSRCIIIVVVTQTLNLKFLLGDNFLISFQFDTLHMVFSCQGTLAHPEHMSLDVWWAWEDSNLRPHAYQACALTT